VDYLDLLSNPAYRHMLLNHVPIIGLCIALVVLVIGIVARHTALLFTGLLLVAVCAGASIPVSYYGDAAYPTVYDSLDRQGRGWLDYHAELAASWLPLLYANTALAILAIVIGVARRPLLKWTALLVALVTLAGVGGAAAVARAGGQIQHPEFRISDPPAVESPRRSR
jgi:hypothetical protein